MSDTYSSIDRSHDPAGAADWQERIDRWRAVRAYKRRSYELLGAARPIVDVGAGTGFDLAALGPAAIGLDLSAVMCARAVARGAIVCRGDASTLPFVDASMAGVRFDRILQHLPDPVKALREAARVTRPGGRVVVADPDQESLVIEVPGVRQELIDAIRAVRRDRHYRHGTFVRRLPHVLHHQLGLKGITMDAFALVLTDPDDAFGLPTWAASGAMTANDIEEWAEGVRRARREGGFVYAVTFFVVAGTI